jgi:hypothetical protein
MSSIPTLNTVDPKSIQNAPAIHDHLALLEEPSE